MYMVLEIRQQRVFENSDAWEEGNNAGEEEAFNSLASITEQNWKLKEFKENKEYTKQRNRETQPKKGIRK